MAITCPTCYSQDIIPIIYGYYTPDLEKRVRNREVVYGGRVPFEGMPTHACRKCRTRFVVGKRKRQARLLVELVSSFTLLLLVGFLVGNVAIISDSLVNSVLRQLFLSSISASAAIGDLAPWLLGLFSGIVLLAAGIVTKRRMVLCGGVGYVVGFVFSAWALEAWWTVVIEMVSLMLFIMVYAIISQ